jgi:Protein of unknown function (DUF3237)
MSLPASRRERPDPEDYYFRIAPFFETAVTQYTWVNNVVAIGIGHCRADGPVYRHFRGSVTWLPRSRRVSRPRFPSARRLVPLLELAIVGGTVRFLVWAISAALRPKAPLAAENLRLRQQLLVLEHRSATTRWCSGA